MKRAILMLAIAVGLSSCVVVNGKPKNASPGQVKKVTGSQSAKPYAPGQQKKASTTTGNSSQKSSPGQQKKKN